jgi:hypothetical protein
MTSRTGFKLGMQALLFVAAFVGAAATLDWITGARFDWAGTAITAVLAGVLYFGFILWRQRGTAGRE